MGEEIALENGRISEFHGRVILTLTLDRVILHIVMHQSSTSTYIPNFIEIEETFCKRTDRRTDIKTDCTRWTRRSRPNNTMHIQTLCEQGFGAKASKSYPDKNWSSSSLQTICHLVDKTGSAVTRRAGRGRPKSVLLQLVNILNTV